ncbi:MAG: hypothetical protein NTU81_02760 [Candidatus Nomurabacteria bacterium]|nr:hypothetical protein [Candidatus Nomurabacteria bacterium]
MENFKFILFSIFIFLLLGFSGYWAFSTIESGSVHVNNQKQIELKQKNEELAKEILKLKKDISLSELEKEQQIQKDKEVQDSKIQEPLVVTTIPTKTTALKYQTLINDIQKLVNSNVVLKLKSKGPSVGIIQKFFNVYNSTSNKIDNDYGATTVISVKNFEKNEGLVINGELGSSDFKKMIVLLKNR